jgi:hypothetical protein
MTELSIHQKRFARWAAKGQEIKLFRGRTDRVGRVRSNTPVYLAENKDQPPILRGAPYWKTGFSNGSFHKVLYTPSSLRIEVGLNWLTKQESPV